MSKSKLQEKIIKGLEEESVRHSATLEALCNKTESNSSDIEALSSQLEKIEKIFESLLIFLASHYKRQLKK
jgi:hypothetical protein